MEKTNIFRSGFVGIIGPPNVGKSTLVNRIVGEKVAIVTDKPQTTRRRILGVKTLPDAQIVLIDTPGLHKPSRELNSIMVKSAYSAILESDIVIHIVDAGRKNKKDNEGVMLELKKVRAPRMLVINKIDLVNKNSLLPLIDFYSKDNSYNEIIPVSALKNDGVDELVGMIVKYLPQGEKLFPDEMLTDQTERQIVAEIVREKLFFCMREELPYSIDVFVEEFDESRQDIVRISAEILVEKDSQKGIVIGKDGKVLRGVGESARKEIERLLGCKVFLRLWVKVRKNWTRDRNFLRMLGYR